MESAMVAAGCVAKNKSLLFIANARTLIYQCRDRFVDCGLYPSVMMAGEDYAHSNLLVVSRDTFSSRVLKRGKIPLPHADVVVVDEVHNGIRGPVMLSILDRYPKAVIIGLTATPGTADGKGLGKEWELIHGATYAELTASGILVPLRVYAPGSPTLKGVGSDPKSHDYRIGQLAEHMMKSTLVGDVVETWKKYAQGRPTVAFTANVAHSIYVCNLFNAAGIPWAHIDGNTPEDDRQRIYASLKDGTICGASNCQVLVAGWDLPEVSCGILLCPTKSIVKFIQMTGRILRSCVSKLDSILLDHSGAVLRHGWPTADREWPTDANDEVKLITDPAAPAPTEPRCCPNCAAMWVIGTTCPACGWKPAARKASQLSLQSGELVEVVASAPNTLQKSEGQKQWLKALARAAHRKLTFQQARILFRQQTGSFPSSSLMPQAPPGQWKLSVDLLFPGFARSRRTSP